MRDTEDADRLTPQSHTETERQLRAIWSEVLDCKPMSLDDTFVELGGESISAMLCVNRIRRTLGISVPLAQLLEDNASIRSVAKWLDERGGAAA